jgi:hypothetical protein
VPIANLSVGDLRLLLTQRIGIEWLVPVALDRLLDDPLIGEFYPGNLLNAVLRATGSHWESHPADLMSLWAVKEALEHLRTDAEQMLGRDDWPAFGWAVSSEQRNIHDEQSGQG